MKIIAVGRNYVDHILELNNERPKEPVIFMKPDTALLADGDDFYYPNFSKDIHYEVELLIKINAIGKNIEAKFAHKYYSEIGIGIDFTARDLQTALKAKGLPWDKAKGFNGSAPISGFINKQEFIDLNNINFSLTKNGEKVQEGNSGLMIWKIDELIAYISQFFTLKVGDVIFTGTPKGVGPVQIGDKLEAYIENKKMLSIAIK